MSFPTRVDMVTLYAGDTSVWPTYEFLTDGEPENLTAYTWAAQWRRTPDAAESVTLAVDTTELAQGRITVSVPAATTEAMVGLGIWDLQATLGAVVRTRLVGPVRVVQDVTRA